MSLLYPVNGGLIDGARVLHFGFFVLACRATDKLRKGASRSHKVNAGA